MSAASPRVEAVAVAFVEVATRRASERQHDQDDAANQATGREQHATEYREQKCQPSCRCATPYMPPLSVACGRAQLSDPHLLFLYGDTGVPPDCIREIASLRSIPDAVAQFAAMSSRTPTVMIPIEGVSVPQGTTAKPAKRQ